jgi:ubiquinone/menaquinone biosynthesis C-methylase UbiE
MKIVPVLRKVTPLKIKQTLRPFYYRLIDLLDSMQSTGDDMIPPKSLRMQIGWGDFKQIGEVIRQRLIESANLQPDDHILDVGCGVGRIAIALLDYLSYSGEYQGFDIMHDAILWCQKNITARRSNFIFLHSDIHNGVYNPNGKIKASEYRYPFENESFDVVILTSVFTHMLPPDLENYLSEIARVLKPGGRALITYYLINPDVRKLIEAGSSSFNFLYNISNTCFYSDKNYPEAVVAYEEAFLRQLYSDIGLTICDPIDFGDWSSQELQKSQQDVVLAVKNTVGSMGRTLS